MDTKINGNGNKKNKDNKETHENGHHDNQIQIQKQKVNEIDILPNQTLYLTDLNDKIKLDGKQCN
jgi:hypothetical protein